MALVTGGASSGKSAHAESCALALPGPHYYLATMQPYGPEALRRIERHRALRAGKGFITVECHEGLADAIGGLAGTGTALLECLGNLVANELFSSGGSQMAPELALVRVLEGLDALEHAFGNVIVVGNEVGCDGMRYDEGTEAYIRVLGSAACAFAQRASYVAECVAGYPHVVKGEMP